MLNFKKYTLFISMLSTIMFFFLFLLLTHRTSLVLRELVIVIAGMFVIRWATAGAVWVIWVSPWFLKNAADYTKIRHVRNRVSLVKFCLEWFYLLLDFFLPICSLSIVSSVHITFLLGFSYIWIIFSCLTFSGFGLMRIVPPPLLRAFSTILN